ncbi:MAG: protoporphyrinogen oxidase [Thermoguttaceae bacterium]|nr:protoporphyrinogen oxidase [Thermoguttaceae bacterium]
MPEQESKQADNRPRIAVVGAGISGLATAWRIRKKAPEVDVAIFEKNERVGGVIGTRIVDRFLCELSVDNFFTTVPWGLDLCKELGFQEELQSTSARYRRTFVVRNRRLYPLPDGFMTMAPTKFYPMLVTPLLTPWGKARCGLELLLPRRRSDEDESLAGFAIRRLGKEAFDRIIEPLVGGIYGGDAAKLSLKATLPRFAEMEEKDRSIIWSMVKSAKKSRRIKREEESGARYSFFVTLRCGLQALPERLADRIGRERVFLGRGVSRVERDGDAWRVVDEAGKAERFDGVVLASDPASASAALRESAPEVADLYGQTERTGVAIVHLAYKNEQVRRPMQGMGFVVPTSEGNGVVAGSFSNYKYPNRAPEGTTLLRVFVGGARAPEMLDLPEEELVRRVSDEIAVLLDVAGAPIFTDVARFPSAMPQYYLGRLAWRERLDRALESTPTLALAGSALDGVGLPACVKSGYDAADKVLANLRKS